MSPVLGATGGVQEVSAQAAVGERIGGRTRAQPRGGVPHHRTNKRSGRRGGRCRNRKGHRRYHGTHHTGFRSYPARNRESASLALGRTPSIIRSFDRFDRFDRCELNSVSALRDAGGRASADGSKPTKNVFSTPWNACRWRPRHRCYRPGCELCLCGLCDGPELEVVQGCGAASS